MAILYLVRHAQAEGNVYRRFHGWYDGMITPLGMRQIAALEERFRDIPVRAVYSSDLRRAMTTARAAADPHDLPVIPEPGLREASLGVFEDMSLGEFSEQHAEEFHAGHYYTPDWDPQGGETFLQVAARMSATVSRLARRHPDETIALFSHSMAIHCFQAAIRGLHPGDLPSEVCPNTGVSCYEIQGDKLRICFESDASHLSPELSKPRAPAPHILFRPMDLSKERELYENARIDAWLQVFPDLLAFDGPSFLSEAADQQLWDPRALQCATTPQGEVIGILQLDTLRGARAGVGHIPFLWIREDMRRIGIGSQLMGQAVSNYRSMGRKLLRLQCSPDNRPAQLFYEKHGFVKAGQVPGAFGSLDLLEKKI